MTINVQSTLETFRAAGIDPRVDFHALTISQVETVIQAADTCRYRRPRNANGSRARYFFYAVQRKLNKE